MSLKLVYVPMFHILTYASWNQHLPLRPVLMGQPVLLKAELASHMWLAGVYNHSNPQPPNGQHLAFTLRLDLPCHRCVVTRVSVSSYKTPVKARHYSFTVSSAVVSLILLSYFTLTTKTCLYLKIVGINYPDAEIKIFLKHCQCMPPSLCQVKTRENLRCKMYF